jgi:hypothetical protein
VPPEEKREEEPSRIELLRRSLYSRNAPDVRTRRKLRFGDLSTDVKTDWEHTPEQPEEVKLTESYDDNSMSFFSKLLIGSIIFCMISVGIGAYLFFNGINLISADNIDITVNGPVSVPGGVPVSFDITITNKNTVDLSGADLTVNFPTGSTDPKNPSAELSNYRELIGDIPRGQSIKKTVQVVIFGEENTQKQVLVDITYQIKGSTSSFTKTKGYDVLVSSSPVNISVDSFKEITAGQEFDLKINVKSNTQDTLKNVLVAATYPFGFSYISSNIKPLTDNSTWRLGNLEPGSERTITIHGKLEGENQETRVFHISVGSQSSRNPNVIGTEYMSDEQEIALQKPFITPTISIDGDHTSVDTPVQFNQPVRVEVSWFNNLSTNVTDANIVIKLSGTAYDKTLVQVGSGFFRSVTDEIIWNPQTTPDLANIGPGEGGSVTFTITPRDLSQPGRIITGPTLSFAVSVNGKRTQESGVPQTLTSVLTKSAHVSTSVSLSGQVVRSIGPFVNTGPIPPRADNKTTYTIQWTIDNTVNPIHGTEVSAKLPVGVTWLNKISPETENVSYDSTTGIVKWSAGTVGTYTTLNSQRRQVAFQVSLEPNVSQVGNVPVLVNDVALTAIDDFTNATVRATQGYLTTRFSTDPAYRGGQEVIVK